MNLLFDYQAFEMQCFGGVSRSYAELIFHLKKKEECVCQVAVKESDNIHLKECGLVKDVKPLYYTHNKWFGGKRKFKGQRTLTRMVFGVMGYHNDGMSYNQDNCIKLLKRQRFDVFEPTFFDPYFLPYLKGKPFVMTVHDMIPELFPQYFRKDDAQILQKRKLCPLASHIHVPSEKTKEDLISILNVSPDKVTVIPHGASKICPNGQFGERLFDFPYLLYVGDRFGYKNFDLLLGGFAKVVKDYKDVHLVCTGKAFNDAERRLISDLNLGDNIVHFYARQESFGSLYHNAIAFVYPSAYEGFGLPILEAFACGCPVLLNEASCFPEVGGDAAVYFDMDAGMQDFYEKFRYLYFMSAEDRANLIEKGNERLSKYSWDESARKLITIYNGLV